MINDGVTGLHFTPVDAADLAAKVRWASAHLEEMRWTRLNAGRVYEKKYTLERNYEMQMEIYESAITRARQESD